MNTWKDKNIIVSQLETEETFTLLRPSIELGGFQPLRKFIGRILIKFLGRPEPLFRTGLWFTCDVFFLRHADRQTGRQTDRQTDRTKNITSFGGCNNAYT